MSRGGFLFSLRNAAATAAITLATLVAPLSAHAGDFIDTRITFLFSDDNIFAGPKDFSPQPDLTQRPGVNTFFDNYNTRDSGQETKTDLAIYRRMTGWHPRLETEAALLIRFDLLSDAVTGQGSQAFADDGTYIQVNWLQGELKEAAAPGRAPRLYFLGFPFNADRMRLGYSYGITWGGREIFPKNSGPVPGLKIGWDGTRGYAYGGLKTHRQLNDNTNQIETEYAFLGGAGVDVTPSFRVEGGAGFFEKGALPPIGGASDPLAGQRVNASGFSGQVTFHKGLPIIGSVDLRLYRNDPDIPFNAFAKETYGPGFSWLASAEISVLGQNLRDNDTFGQTRIQSAIAGDVNLKLKTGFTRAYADLVYRDLSFILFNVPSFTPYAVFPKSAKVAPQVFVDFGADHYLQALHMTPGFTFGLENPATFLGNTTFATGGSVPGVNLVVVRKQGDFTILPPGQGAFAIISARAYDRFEISDMLTMIGQLTYTLDKNATELVVGPGGVPARVFKGSNVTNQLAIAAIFQARF